MYPCPRVSIGGDRLRKAALLGAFGGSIPPLVIGLVVFPVLVVLQHKIRSLPSGSESYEEVVPMAENGRNTWTNCVLEAMFAVGADYLAGELPF